MTTTVVYPDAHAESTTVDGQVIKYDATYNSTWATIRDASSGTSAIDQETVFGFAYYIATSNTSNKYGYLTRGFFLFNTSAVGAGDSISGATISLYKYSTSNSFSTTPPALDIVSSNPASNTAIGVDDYDQVGSTVLGSVAYASIASGSYTDISLDSAAVTKAGITKLASRCSWDTANSPTWEAAKEAYVRVYFADNAGTTNDPKLTVVHEAPTTAKLVSSYRRRRV